MNEQWQWPAPIFIGALDNIGGTKWNSCFPLSLTSSSSSRDRNKYGGIWRPSIKFCKGWKGRFLCYCDAIYPGLLVFACSMNIIPPYFSHERKTMMSETPETTIFVRFYFTLCYLMLTFSLSHELWKTEHFTLLLSRNLIQAKEVPLAFKLLFLLFFHCINSTRERRPEASELLETDDFVKQVPLWLTE